MIQLLSHILVMIMLAAIPANPNLKNRNHYVTDVTGKMSAGAIEETNAILGSLRAQTTAEVAVLITDNTDGDDINPYAVRVFEDWKLGKADKDNGALLVIDTGGRKATLLTGYGLEGVLPDAACKTIIERYVVPNMKRGDLNAAVVESMKAVSEVLRDPASVGEIRSNQKEVTPQSQMSAATRDTFRTMVTWVAGGALILSLVIFYRMMKRTRRLDRYGKASVWKGSLKGFILCTLFSCGLALPFLGAAWILYRRARNAPRRCDTCGAKMRRLSEEEDNAYLSASQDLEERLGSVDYDVWVCDKCHTIERFPYLQAQTKYQRCPSCGTVAYTMVSDRVVTSPTLQRPGMGIKRYQCQYCGHHEDQNYHIDRKRDDSAAQAAILGGILGAAAGSRRGGGGGFGGFGGGGCFGGGGFGGGSTGGGGASGSW